jgi:hypothetical protein
MKRKGQKIQEKPSGQNHHKKDKSEGQRNAKRRCNPQNPKKSQFLLW